MPVTLAILEAEIRRITFRGQPGQIILETLSQNNPSQQRSGGVAQGVDPKFKSQHYTHTQKKPTSQPCFFFNCYNFYYYYYFVTSSYLAN
jgi:hypothetical protein